MRKLTSLGAMPWYWNVTTRITVHGTSSQKKTDNKKKKEYFCLEWEN